MLEWLMVCLLGMVAKIQPKTERPYVDAFKHFFKNTQCTQPLSQCTCLHNLAVPKGNPDGAKLSLLLRATAVLLRVCISDVVSRCVKIPSARVPIPSSSAERHSVHNLITEIILACMAEVILLLLSFAIW